MKELTATDIAKRAAAAAAVAAVEDGMKLGLGTGSTVAWFIDLLGERIKADGLKVQGVPTSVQTGERSQRCKIPLTTLDEAGWLDLTVDGADEFDSQLNLTKGGGGALLQEKIVATASDRMIVIADEGKEVKTLGAFPLPIEIVPFAWETTRAIVAEALEDFDVDGRDVTLRMKTDEPFITDGGHFILDLHLRRIGEAAEMSAFLNTIPGVTENGLFIGVADRAIVGCADGTTRFMDASEEDF